MTTTRRLLTATAVLAMAIAIRPAGQAPPAGGGALDAAARGQIIDGAVAHMRRAYIFADVAEQMAAALQAHAAKGTYDRIVEPREFADVLTRHLQEVSRDRHLRIIYDPAGLPRRSGPPTDEERARRLADERRQNFGFRRVERLDGNVGYIDLMGFSGSPQVKEAAVPAMNFVANTDALIFDLRRNGGGSPVTIGILSSYLFDRVVHLNDFYIREADRTEQFFTSAEVDGHRYGEQKPVFVLTSARTFSAAEEFTYNLKHLKRATIVGETTGGGAHPGGVRPITERFGIWLPNGRAINPVTKTNWEGVGIEPDIKVPADQALGAAHLAALERIREGAIDTRHREAVERAIADLKKGGMD